MMSYRIRNSEFRFVPIDSVLFSAFNRVVSGDEWGDNFAINTDFNGGDCINKFECDRNCDCNGPISLTSVDGAEDRNAVDAVDDGSISTDGLFDRGNINWPITSCPEGVRICTNSPKNVILI